MKKTRKAKSKTMDGREEFALLLAGIELFGHSITRFKSKLWEERLDIIKAARKSLGKSRR